MKGQKQIEKIQKAPLCWREKANEIIAVVNLPVVGAIVDNTNGGETSDFGYIEWVASDQKIKVTFYAQTIDVIGCDAEGNQHTYRMIGYQLPDPA